MLSCWCHFSLIVPSLVTNAAFRLSAQKVSQSDLVCIPGTLKRAIYIVQSDQIPLQNWIQGRIRGGRPWGSRTPLHFIQGWGKPLNLIIIKIKGRGGGGGDMLHVCNNAQTSST